VAVLRPLFKRAIERPRPVPLVWPPLNIAHRGAAGVAPENTLAAFDLATRQGADGIELDVHLASDGIPVVIHDPRLQRTTSGSGWVRDYRSSALRRLDAGSWFNRRYPSRAQARFAGLKIPLLSEALALARDRQCLVFVEIKQGGKIYPGIEAKVLREIHRAGLVKLATIISFDRPTLRRVRQLDSRVPLGIDFTRPILAIRRAKALGAAAVMPHWAFASRRFIRRAHKAGLHVIVWDLDQPGWMRRKITDGVDGAVTRYPARFAEILAGYNATS
jgi:glycerophosphoryl diester phosphodiesterase